MIKVVCPVCKEEDDYEVVKVAAEERKYEVRCLDCGCAFVVCGKDDEKQSHHLSSRILATANHPSKGQRNEQNQPGPECRERLPSKQLWTIF